MSDRAADTPGGFVRLARSPTATGSELLIALAGEFAVVDAPVLQAQLDDDARALFGLPALEPDLRGDHVLHVLRDVLGYRCDHDDDPRGVLLPEVVRGRAGHSLAIAAIAADLARRAGDQAIVCSSLTHWLVAIGQPGEASVMDGGLRAAPLLPPPGLRAQCAHQLAYSTLTALVDGYARRACHDIARRASALRLALPLDGVLRAGIEHDVQTRDRNRPS